jgi:hypothetical protein
MGKALKQADNDHFRSKYADLGNVMDACMPALNEAGIAVIQPTGEDEHGRYVETILIHGESGETLACRVPLIINKNDMQAYGSAVSYARRYGLLSMAGVASASDDDDGNAAVAGAPKAKPRIPAPMTEHEFNTVKDLLEQTETDQDKFCQYWKVKALHELTGGQAQNAIAMLKKKAAS